MNPARQGGQEEGATAAEAGVPPTPGEIAREFLRISLLGFGGPNAHLALMLEAVVERRRWIDREHFLHLVGMTHLLPGPNSSEVAIHIGYTQRGWRGALAAGSAFLGPTFLLMLGLSAIYFRYGALPAVQPLFWGLKPAIVAVILGAGWRLGRTAIGGAPLLALALAGGAVAVWAGRWQVAAMLAGGVVGWWLYGRRGTGSSADGGGDSTAAAAPGGDEQRSAGSGPVEPEKPGKSAQEEGETGRGEGGVTGPGGVGVAVLAVAQGVAGGGAGVIGQLFLLTLGIGATMFGGGYVLVALLQPYAVERFGWLTSPQFLDGVALSQAVPGPISTLAAFVGYAAAGAPGAVVATMGIYIPALVAVLLVAPHLERWRHQFAIRGALKGVNAVVAGAVVGTALALVPPAVPDVWAAALLALACIAVVRGATAPQLVGGGLLAGLVALIVGAG
jgi:chromate transporter